MTPLPVIWLPPSPPEAQFSGIGTGTRIVMQAGMRLGNDGAGCRNRVDRDD